MFDLPSRQMPTIARDVYFDFSQWSKAYLTVMSCESLWPTLFFSTWARVQERSHVGNDMLCPILQASQKPKEVVLC